MRAHLFVALSVAAATLTAPRAADAFCGFYVAGADTKLYNNATQVVMMRKGTRTVLSMQNNYQGPPENFAMVVPVPMVLQEDNVKTLPHDVFKRIDSLAAPRLVEYWEQDPCYKPPPVERRRMEVAAGARPAPSPDDADDTGVTVEAQFEVGEYQIVILSARDSSGLETWLKREKYKIPDGAEPFLRPYVQAGSKFFVARVNAQKVTFNKQGMATLSPLRFFYDSDDFTLPVRLGLMNAQDKQDLIVHILAPNQRYEVANFPNVTIPTNLDVIDDARKRFGEFYAALFDRTVEKNPRAVVTEYAWDAGTCDPCPTPALNMGELMTLGLDVLDAPMPEPKPRPAKGAAKPGPKKGDAVDDLLAKPSVAPRRPPMPRPQYVNFVLTRLHARYDASSLTDDLVFRQASPISGGREVRNPQGKLEHGSSPASRNNFQARYAIRHPWTGPITCDNPRRGVWGGPPPGKSSQGIKPALDLAFAPRGKAKLASMVKQDIPEIGVKPAAGAPDDSPKQPASGGDADKKKEEKKGCSAAGGGGAPLLILLFAAALVWRRRRR